MLSNVSVGEEEREEVGLLALVAEEGWGWANGVKIGLFVHTYCQALEVSGLGEALRDAEAGVCLFVAARRASCVSRELALGWVI